ncbi:DUF4129 domain-containing protein [Haloarcula salina]|uniref:DUF4129 domain-containing protein n=1 Tax=Haloarcula salina TaxID=1429914 RepID=A0AA41KD71_9EURY|nr:DUF4129 domain-containing protein [Haloarcula salina]MBV0903220.1 DUF4129 domain-containing protein [Haloarcula salina]
MNTDSASERGSGVDRRQLALVGLSLVGIVVAAFLAPPPAVPGGVEASPSGDDVQQAVPTATSTDEDANRATRRTDRDGGRVTGSGDPIPIPGDEPPAAEGCGVVVERRPTPGSLLTVRVYQDLRPAASTRVWFDDRYVGRTDDDGRATGRVPYQRQLNVTVETPGGAPCEFFRRTATDSGSNRQIEPLSASLVGPTAAVSAPVAADRQARAGRETPVAQRTPVANSTGRYGVGGRVNVSVVGDPYPGSTVTLVAAVESAPMRHANVSVAGEHAGRTDGEGRYRLTVPDRDAVSVTVQRGAFDGSRRVDVLDLSVRVDPGEGLPVPGETASVTATRGGEPVADATVTVGGQDLGATGPNGSLAVALPANPAATVTVATERQTAATTLWSVYAWTIVVTAVLLVLAAVTVAAAAFLYDRGAARRLGVAWAAFDVVYLAFVLWEHDGLAVALGAVAVAALYRYRTTAASGGESAVAVLARITDWSRRTALRVATGIESALSRLGRLAARAAAWLRSLSLSPSSLGGRLGRWLRSVGRRTVARFSAAFTVRRAVVVGLSGASVALSAARWGVGGGLTTVAALAVVGSLALLWHRPGDSSPTDPEPGTTETGERVEPSAEPDDAPASLRALWRAFARWIAPRGWRTRTPAEVSRAAIERGLPREPVEALTRAFREVEYGGAPTESHRDRARAAFDALVAAREREDER